jgi:hypothetical protein
MNMDAELDRLAAMYAENDDETLLEMYDRRDDLTDLAQEALERVMKERGVVPAEHVEGSAAEAEEDEPESEGETDLFPGEVGLWLFRDMFDARSAMDALTSAEIEHRMVDRSVMVSGGLTPRPDARFLLVVFADDQSKAEAVLRQRMGMFQPQEVVGEDPFADLLGFVPLANGSREGGLKLARTLGEAGYSYVWDDSLDGEFEGTRSHVAISVKRTQYKKVMKLLGDKDESWPGADWEAL